jgi:opacity protein-like surface antigen
LLLIFTAATPGDNFTEGATAMKKILSLIVAILIVAFASIVFADDTKVSLGIRAWSNSWEEKVDFSGGGSQTFKMGSALMVGPSLNVRFSNNLFVSATYLVTTKDYESSGWFNAGDSMSIKRKDMDLAVGYMIIPQFGVFAGYKTLNADLSYTFTPGGFNNFDAGSWTLKGPGFGILGNIPISDMIAIYGNLGILFMKEEIQVTGGGTEKNDMTGATLEIGVAFAFTSSLSANVGFKSQAFTGEDAVTKDKVTETFSGLTLGLNYTF